MKTVIMRWMPFLVVVVAFLAGPGVSYAFAQQGTPFDMTTAKAETMNIARFLLGALMMILAVAGAATIVHGLVAARKKGEWGEFLGGVAMAIIAFVAFVGFLKMGNHDAARIMTEFQIK